MTKKDAQVAYLVGCLYRDGNYVKRDLDKAEEWYSLAVKHGGEGEWGKKAKLELDRLVTKDVSNLTDLTSSYLNLGGKG